MPRIIGLILVLISLILNCSSEIRFCYKGPHLVTKNDCPYGVFFKERIKVNCIVKRAGEKYGTGSIKYALDICEPDQLVDIPEDPLAETKDLWIQKISFNDFQPPTEPVELVEDNSTCIETCFDQSEFVVNSEPEDIPPHEDNLPQKTPEMDQAQLEISKRLFPHLTSGSSSKRPGSKLRIFELLKDSTKVAETYCGEPWISDTFWKQVLEYLSWLIVNKSKYKSKDMGKRDFENIQEILETCRAESESVKFDKDGPECGKKKSKIRRIHVKVLGQEQNKTYLNRLYPKSYRWGKFDPFLEAAWSVIDLTHSICYKFFAPHLNLYHLYQQHLESLFPEIVIQRWVYPPVLRSESYWNTLANVYDLKTVMHNLQFCAQAAVHYSPFSKRLDRPFSTPAVEDEDIIKGWSHGVPGYWHEYRQLGGFPGIVPSFGHCAKSEAEAETFQKDLQEIHC